MWRTQTDIQLMTKTKDRLFLIGLQPKSVLRRFSACICSTAKAFGEVEHVVATSNGQGLYSPAAWLMLHDYYRFVTHATKQHCAANLCHVSDTQMIFRHCVANV